MKPCREWAGELAALSVDALTDEERAAVLAHVDGCAGCRQALDELESTADLLDLVDADQWAVATVPPAGLDTRVIAAVEDQARRERRRSLATRWGLVAAGSAAAIAIVAGGSLMLTNQVAPEAVVVSLQPAGEASRPTANATLTTRPWGTEIDLAVDGSTPGTTYRVWLATADGTRTPAGTFIGQDRPMRMSLAAALPRDQVVELGISSDETDRYLVAPIGL